MHSLYNISKIKNHATHFLLFNALSHFYQYQSSCNRSFKIELAHLTKQIEKIIWFLYGKSLIMVRLSDAEPRAQSSNQGLVISLCSLLSMVQEAPLLSFDTKAFNVLVKRGPDDTSTKLKTSLSPAVISLVRGDRYADHGLHISRLHEQPLETFISNAVLHNICF